MRRQLMGLLLELEYWLRVLAFGGLVLQVLLCVLILAGLVAFLLPVWSVNAINARLLGRPAVWRRELAELLRQARGRKITLTLNHQTGPMGHN